MENGGADGRRRLRDTMDTRSGSTDRTSRGRYSKPATRFRALFPRRKTFGHVMVAICSRISQDNTQSHGIRATSWAYVHLAALAQVTVAIQLWEERECRDGGSVLRGSRRL
ncbi:hypothetical protein HGRIS_004372 [Hohenbuehelia grisea]|uniref:Uncharacterized protein n=1 Tax=Hohenbuehelia grisea TaxID=104357 RepID=A0ABR3JBM3_9AGAR